MKYAVGDKVKVISGIDDGQFFNKMGTVKEIRPNRVYPYRVDIDGMNGIEGENTLWTEHELEAVK